MCLAEILNRLDAEGLPLKPRTLYFLIGNQSVPRPPRDASGRFDFSEKHLNALRKYVREKQATSKPLSHASA